MYEATKRRRFNRVAPSYDLLDLPFEVRRYRTMRPQLFAGISGSILDADVGTGRILPFYPEGCQVTGIDFDTIRLVVARPISAG